MTSTKPVRLLSEERRRRILELLGQDGRVTVVDLVQRFGVSAVTARADLDALATEGFLVRSHGGAVSRAGASRGYAASGKSTLHHAEKVRIGHAAAALVQPDQTIILGAGTTTLEIARQLKASTPKGLTVITNALNVAAELMGAPNLPVIMIGGILRNLCGCFVGPQAERMLLDLHADICFLGVDGLDLEAGPTTPDVLEAELNNVMIRVSGQAIIVADASKIGRRSMSSMGSLPSIGRLITDNRIEAAMAQALEVKGLEVTVV